MSRVPIPNIDLLKMRRTTREHLPENVEVWRRTWASDSQGGRTETLALVSSGPGRVGTQRSSMSSERPVAERWAKAEEYWITVEHDRDVRLGDQLRINGIKYEVARMDSGQSWHMGLRMLAYALETT